MSNLIVEENYKVFAQKIKLRNKNFKINFIKR